jgi:predicted HTH transcriptional regulator
VIPKNLSDWSKDIVINMLSKKLFETEQFDYKEKLPEKNDKKAKIRLLKTCSAFANSKGGFIVFGVDDDKTKKPIDRIKGLDKNFDFPEHFGNYPKKCIPSVYWDFLNPPIPLENKKVLHVVFIPKSVKSPHAVGNLDEGWFFTKRTNKGNECMAIEEIRNDFLGFYEKHLKLNLLRSELITIRDNASLLLITKEEVSNKEYSLVSFESRIIESVISDSYTILAKEEQLLSTLSSLRQHIGIANNKIRIFFGVVATSPSNIDDIIIDHHIFMHTKSNFIIQLCDKAIHELSRYIDDIRK